MEGSEQTPPAEFVVANPERLADFYENVFGWRALVYNRATGHWLVCAPKNPLGDPTGMAIVIHRIISGPTGFLYNFWVEDLVLTTSKVEANGGKIYLEEEELGADIMEIPKVGRQRFFCDPEGNMFGAIEPEK